MIAEASGAWTLGSTKGFAFGPYQGAFSTPWTPPLGKHFAYWLNDNTLSFFPIHLNCHLPKISDKRPGLVIEKD